MQVNVKERLQCKGLFIVMAVCLLVYAVAALMGGRDLSSDVHSNGLTCANATVADAERCRRIEAKILNATVRFVVESWSVRSGRPGYDMNYSMGHGTVKDGRYLVTHNHFDLPLSIRPRAGEPQAYGALTIFDSEGVRRFRGSLSDFHVIWEDAETLVFGHSEPDFFEKLGFVSAEFHDWSSMLLLAGMEVAQVDWNGTTTRVDWTTVEEIVVVDGSPRLTLADGVKVGASGGGIFWQGVHIANNSYLVQIVDESGAQISERTRAALNSVHVAVEPYHKPCLLAEGNGSAKAC